LSAKKITFLVREEKRKPCPWKTELILPLKKRANLFREDVGLAWSLHCFAEPTSSVRAHLFHEEDNLQLFWRREPTYFIREKESSPCL
jgi:hypothetical protein